MEQDDAPQPARWTAKGRLVPPVSASPNGWDESVGSILPTTQAPSEVAVTALPLASWFWVAEPPVPVSWVLAGIGPSNIASLVLTCCQPEEVRWPVQSDDEVEPLTAQASVPLTAATDAKSGAPARGLSADQIPPVRRSA